ncbi:MAG: Zn-ribbon containing protein [Nanoarchaeota archaeon]
MHQCVKCSRIIPVGSKEILEGCKECKGRFFFYVKDEQMSEVKENLIEIPTAQRKSIEKDVRDMAGITDDQAPVILDIESIRITGEGKFELDIAKLFKKGRPLIYKLEEGKYIIDLASTLSASMKELKEIRDPDKL